MCNTGVPSTNVAEKFFSLADEPCILLARPTCEGSPLELSIGLLIGEFLVQDDFTYINLAHDELLS